jgi:hypothetical protein
MAVQLTERWKRTASDLWVRFGDGEEYVPDPPVSTVGFGFNIWSSYDGYTDGAAESADAMTTRLNTHYGPYEYTKSFYGSAFIPSTWNGLNTGERSTNQHATKHIVCCSWTPGTIANGSRDSYLSTFAATIPAGHTVMPCINEVDAPGRMSDWTAYRNDMNHLYDLANTLNASNPGRLESWDCFMEFAMEAASGPRWQDSWTNAAKRHGIIWDCYWNQFGVDDSGNTFCGNMEGVMNRLGFDQWILGEFGDRRPGSTGSNPAPSDAARAPRMQTIINRILASDPAPVGLVYFNTIGTTGDHRVLRPPYGNDDLMYAMLADYYTDAWAATH